MEKTARGFYTKNLVLDKHKLVMPHELVRMST